MKKHKYTTTFTPINHTWNQLKETKTGNYEFTSVEETASPLKYLPVEIPAYNRELQSQLMYINKTNNRESSE